jgi:hypothetical protein
MTRESTNAFKFAIDHESVQAPASRVSCYVLLASVFMMIISFNSPPLRKHQGRECLVQIYAEAGDVELFLCLGKACHMINSRADHRGFLRDTLKQIREREGDVGLFVF